LWEDLYHSGGKIFTTIDLMVSHNLVLKSSPWAHFRVRETPHQFLRPVSQKKSGKVLFPLGVEKKQGMHGGEGK